MGAMAGISGACSSGSAGAVDPNSGSDFLLPVVAAVIIGGTPLAGGAGTIYGALIGVLIIAVIGSGVIFLGIDAVWSTFVTGFVIVVAVGVDQLGAPAAAARRANPGLDLTCPCLDLNPTTEPGGQP